jgi:hypothetical protein
VVWWGLRIRFFSGLCVPSGRLAAYYSFAICLVGFFTVAYSGVAALVVSSWEQCRCHH